MYSWISIVLISLTGTSIAINALKSEKSNVNKVSFFLWKIKQRTFLLVLLAFQALALASLVLTTLI